MRLELINLSKSYQDGSELAKSVEQKSLRELKVIDDVNFLFPEKGLVGIVGSSGVGKSTLLQLLGGLDKPNTGSIFFDDTELSALSGDTLSNFRGSKIGFVFQFHHLLPEFSAVENVAMPLVIAGKSDAAAQKEALLLLDAVGLYDRASHLPRMLSGGEQQRVAIARALSLNPSLILLDEPTGNLDQKNAESVFEILRSMNQRLHNLMIVVTHSMQLASRLDVSFEMQPGGALKKI
jgi:lipoprotein-releasing system ATP-binding protein